MSYGFFLVRLPAGVDRDEAYRQKLEEEDRVSDGKPDHVNPGPIDPRKEREKQRLAAALMARHPTLELYRRNYPTTARALGIDELEARRRFRHLELNEKQLSIQITLFDDAAGVSFSFDGDARGCARAARVLWDCLEILEFEGGFSTYDTQIDKILDLKSDFGIVLKQTCGVDEG